jgi:hypothetical protein
MFLRVLFIFPALILLFAGCKNDLEINAPYKEMPSIYAVLCPQEAIQVIRINKVFLGEGDANLMAKISDSVNYAPGEIEVSLTRFLNDVQVDAAPGEKRVVFRDSSVTTAEGAFNTNQRIYVTSKKLFTSGEYRLRVENLRTKNVFTAKATSIDSIKPGYRPLTDSPSYPYSPYTSPDEYIQYDNKNGTVRFSPNEAKLYQLRIRTHYIDSTLNKQSFHYLDYDFSTREERTKTFSGAGIYIVYDFRTVDYWNAMGIALRNNNPPEQVFGRRAYMVEYIVYGSTQDYVDYLQYSAPSFGLTQNSVIYSNFDNKAAIGIFTFRSRFSVKKQPSSGMVNEFARNINTCEFRFYDSKLVVGNCPQ